MPGELRLSVQVLASELVPASELAPEQEAEQAEELELPAADPLLVVDFDSVDRPIKSPPVGKCNTSI